MSLPPGSAGLPGLGETLDFIKDPFTFVSSRFKKHGPLFRTSILGENVACFVGPDAFAAFLDDDNFTRDKASPPGLRRLLSEDAVPFLDGDAHLQRKRALMQAVGPAALPTYLPTLREACASRLAKWAEKGSILAADEMAELAFAVNYAIFGGGDVHQPDAKVRRDFDRFTAGVITVPIDLPFTVYGKALNSGQRLRRHFAAQLAKKKATPGPDVLSALVATGLADDVIVTETLHFFFAAYAGMWAFLTDLLMALAEHDDVRRRVQAEADLEGPYLECVVKEVRRFYPVIPFTFFARARRDVAFGGYTVPQGWKALGCTFATMHDDKTFPNPEKFDPDRFNAERAEDKRHACAFVPQGGGSVERHRCAGEAFSTLLLKVFALELLRGYDVALPPQDKTLTLSSLPPIPRDRLKLTIRART